MSPFPKYVENPPKELKRIDSKPDEKGKFRSMSSVSTRPTPSITMMSVKRSMHSSLRKWDDNFLVAILFHNFVFYSIKIVKK